MIKDDIKQGDKLVVNKGDFKGLKLFVRDTFMGARDVKQIVLARQDNDLDFCRESEAEVKRLCEHDK
jgi:hypothetical protein